MKLELAVKLVFYLEYKLLSEDIKKHIAFRAMTYGSAAAFLCIT